MRSAWIVRSFGSRPCRAFKNIHCLFCSFFVHIFFSLFCLRKATMLTMTTILLLPCEFLSLVLLFVVRPFCKLRKKGYYPLSYSTCFTFNTKNLFGTFGISKNMYYYMKKFLFLPLFNCKLGAQLTL